MVSIFFKVYTAIRKAPIFTDLNICLHILSSEERVGMKTFYLCKLAWKYTDDRSPSPPTHTH